MSLLVLLDSGPLGEVSNPASGAAHEWMTRLVERGDHILIPEIVDYEVRRELVRANKRHGLRRLDELAGIPGGYLPLSTPVIRLAAQLWADMRNAGTPTAPPEALDGDVILAAQARLVHGVGDDVVVATTNVQHLQRLTDAVMWNEL